MSDGSAQSDAMDRGGSGILRKPNTAGSSGSGARFRGGKTDSGVVATRFSRSSRGFSEDETGFAGLKTRFRGSTTGFSEAKTGFAGTETKFSASVYGFRGANTEFSRRETGFRRSEHRVPEGVCNEFASDCARGGSEEKVRQRGTARDAQTGFVGLRARQAGRSAV
jgi:hypothetical protein